MGLISNVLSGVAGVIFSDDSDSWFKSNGRSERLSEDASMADIIVKVNELVDKVNELSIEKLDSSQVRDLIDEKVRDHEWTKHSDV